jgi:DNA polymerase I-like protein with 3'-5' exonuclease and polymerase domains
MTYKELLQSLADQASANYSAYLQSKIDAVEDTEDQLLPEKTGQYKDSYERMEKKFIAILSRVKNDGSLEADAPDEVVDDTTK